MFLISHADYYLIITNVLSMNFHKFKSINCYAPSSRSLYLCNRALAGTEDFPLNHSGLLPGRCWALTLFPGSSSFQERISRKTTFSYSCPSPTHNLLRLEVLTDSGSFHPPYSFSSITNMSKSVLAPLAESSCPYWAYYQSRVHQRCLRSQLSQYLSWSLAT